MADKWLDEPYLVVYTNDGMTHARLEYEQEVRQAWAKYLADERHIRIVDVVSPEGRYISFANCHILALAVHTKENRIAAMERAHALNKERAEWHTKHSEEEPNNYADEERRRYGG